MSAPGSTRTKGRGRGKGDGGEEEGLEEEQDCAISPTKSLHAYQCARGDAFALMLETLDSSCSRGRGNALCPAMYKSARLA